MAMQPVAEGEGATNSTLSASQEALKKTEEL